MKTQKILILTTLLCLIGLATACKNDNDVEIVPICECLYIPFMKTYISYYDDIETYLIKGVALDVIDGYGRKIKLIEDLKGNFTRNINSTFTVWGALVCRADNLSAYNNQDTLIMLLNPAIDNKFKITVDGKVYHERVGDYVTLGCGHSVIKLSNSNVYGFMLPIEEGKHSLYDTISCEEFKIILQTEVNLCE